MNSEKRREKDKESERKLTPLIPHPFAFPLRHFLSTNNAESSVDYRVDHHRRVHPQIELQPNDEQHTNKLQVLCGTRVESNLVCSIAPLNDIYCRFFLNNQCVPCCTGNEKGPQAEECCLCDPETGGCRNSSPAGKRRVPGTEFSADTAISETYFDSDSKPSNNDSASLAVTAATTMAVAICLASIALFAMIFVALQAWSGRREANMGYTQLAVKVEPSEDPDTDDATELMT
ncbi:uncharacterized protein LOC115238628 [Formica exsecta]|uniref:uncharacterized protein LOC115238628 n=1 Tax=Formica exsecta TaxID=72781 RepID=UPI0011428F30|nr:uncharacterized protein LOC115238628 [Formica exsecta]